MGEFAESGRLVGGGAMPGRNQDGANPELEELEAILGYRFARRELLELALTHRSYVYDGGPARLEQADPSRDNEQLEFVGDAVLGLLVAEAVYRRFPGKREGELTKMRAALVSREGLGEVGTRIGLGRWLRLGGTAKRGGKVSAALVSNALEAVVAAIYLDAGPEQGLAAARAFVEREILGGDGVGRSLKDDKTALQELVQGENLGRVVYEPVSEAGPAHKREFGVAVRLEGEGERFGELARATGMSKKQAQKEAARMALEVLAGFGLGGGVGAR
jgi:ribonuclease-3